MHFLLNLHGNAECGNKSQNIAKHAENMSKKERGEEGKEAEDEGSRGKMLKGENFISSVLTPEK